MNFSPLERPRIGKAVAVALFIVFAAGVALIIEQCAVGLAKAGV
jgi:hypothetical protein